jgi:hypothetical protein
MGLVLEGYGPVGEKRTKDLAGRPVEAKASFPGGGEGTGLAGLREYVRAHRQGDFLDNLARKLLAYGLSRSLTLSDEPTIREMRARLERDEYRFDSLIEGVVTSKQFPQQTDAHLPSPCGKALNAPIDRSSKTGRHSLSRRAVLRGAGWWWACPGWSRCPPGRGRPRPPPGPSAWW